MTEREKLFNEIRNDKEFADCTDEEIEEMVTMELGASEIKNYTQAQVEKKTKKPREKKIDEDKKAIIEIIAKALNDNGYNATITNVDKEIDFGVFTVNLVKHRPPKK